MKKSAFLSDIFFTFCGVSLFTLCLFRYHKIALLLAFMLSVLCGVLASASLWAFLQSKRRAFSLKKSDERKKQKLLTHLCLLSDEQKTSFFAKIWQKSGEVKRFGKLRLHTDTDFYFLHFRFSPVTADEVASFSRLKTSKNRALLCNNITDEAKTLCDSLHVQVFTGEKVYAFVKENDALPETFLGEAQTANKRKRRLRLCFAKSNGKRFFVGGALILATSLLTPFPYYYLVFGSILLLAALFIRIFGYV